MAVSGTGFTTEYTQFFANNSHFLKITFSQVRGLADKYIQESHKIIIIDHTTATTSAFLKYAF